MFFPAVKHARLPRKFYIYHSTLAKGLTSASKAKSKCLWDKSKWGIPERDIWSLCAMGWGSGRIGELSARRRRRRRRRHLEILKNRNFDKKNPKCSNVHIYNFHPSKIQILEKIPKSIKIPHFYPLWGAYKIWNLARLNLISLGCGLWEKRPSTQTVTQETEASYPFV